MRREEETSWTYGWKRANTVNIRRANTHTTTNTIYSLIATTTTTTNEFTLHWWGNHIQISYSFVSRLKRNSYRSSVCLLVVIVGFNQGVVFIVVDRSDGGGDYFLIKHLSHNFFSDSENEEARTSSLVADKYVERQRRHFFFVNNNNKYILNGQVCSWLISFLILKRYSSCRFCSCSFFLLLLLLLQY